jgi:predicted nucleic acid-binding protein
MKTVFVDTSGFYACLDGTDPFHPTALAKFEQAELEGWNLVTTSYVVHETWALVQRRLGWVAVDTFLDDLLPRCDIAWVDQTLHDLGTARCRQKRERRLSLTDAVSIEYLKREQISAAIAEDEHFTRENITLP